MRTLQSTLILYFGLITIIPLVFLGGILFFIAHDNLESEITKNFRAESENLGNSMRLLYDLRIQQIEILSLNPYFEEILQNRGISNTSSENLFEILKIFESSTGGNYDQIFTNIVGFYQHSVISKHGDVIFSTDTDLVGTPKTVDDTSSVSYVVNNNLNKREMIVTTPIFDVSSKTYLGNLESVMGVKTTNHILIDSRIFQTDENYLVNMDKVMISESRFVDSMSSEIVVDTKAVQMCIEHGKNHIGFYDDYRGVPIFGSSYCAKDLGFVLLREIDADELFYPLDELVITLILSAFGFGAMAMIFGIIVSKRITNPVILLKKNVNKIALGDLNAEIKIKGQNEIFDLVESFDIMLKSLKMSDSEIQKQHSIILENLEELKKTDIQKNEFAAVASHELKTPIVPIKGYLEMLLEDDLLGNLNPKQKEVLEKSYSNIEILEKLILRLLLVNRLELNQVKWSISDFNVIDLMKTIHSDNQRMMDEKKITFTNLATESVEVSSDFDNVKEIFSNLLQNAVDFTPENGTIEIDAKKQDGLIVFSIKDSGIGIPKDKQDGLFKKFYQVDTSVTRKHGGTGLGLSICKGLTEGLGGKIWVESQEGKGSTFYFSILKKFKQNNP